MIKTSTSSKPDNKYKCNSIASCIVIVIICALAIIGIIYFIMIGSHYTEKNGMETRILPLFDDWSIEDTAFASGYEGLVFKAFNNKTNKIGAFKVYLDVNDSGIPFKTKTSTTASGPRSKTAMEAYKEEVNALIKAKDCPFIIPLLNYSANVVIKPCVTFTEERNSPIIITSYMNGGSLSDFVENAEKVSERVSIQTLKLWNKQMMDAAACAGKRGIQFNDRNLKNFVLDDHSPPNVYIIDISLTNQANQDYVQDNIVAIKRLWESSIIRNGTIYEFVTYGSFPLKKMKIDAAISEVEDFLNI